MHVQKYSRSTNRLQVVPHILQCEKHSFSMRAAIAGNRARFKPGIKISCHMLQTTIEQRSTGLSLRACGNVFLFPGSSTPVKSLNASYISCPTIISNVKRIRNAGTLLAYADLTRTYADLRPSMFQHDKKTTADPEPLRGPLRRAYADLRAPIDRRVGRWNKEAARWNETR